jgi:hypothetical protein
MRQILIIAILLFSSKSFSQENPDYLLWDSTFKITIDDFGIKKSDSQSGSSFALFTIEHNVSGLDFLTKNFNKKVKNFMIKSGSWIDTTYNVESSLKYQQTLFNIAEIYSRQFRKELQTNRKQISKGLTIVHDIFSKISSDFAKRRLEYDAETNYGNDIQKQEQWDIQIKKDLEELSDYDYNK